MGLPLDSQHELPAFDDPFAEWDAADEAAVAATHAPLPRARRQARSPRRHASTSSRRAPPSGQEIFDEEEETEEDAPSTTASTPTQLKMRTPPRTSPKMKMMSRWTSCSFSFPFWHLMTKGE